VHQNCWQLRIALRESLRVFRVLAVQPGSAVENEGVDVHQHDPTGTGGWMIQAGFVIVGSNGDKAITHVNSSVSPLLVRPT
jgi:hypothetical protein